MFFSICIPTYNRAKYIVRTLESLRKQLFKDFEVIVVDDGSVDETQQCVEKFNDLHIKYLKKENGGKHSALNVGLNESRGFFFLVLDSDDVLKANALQEMYDIWNKAPTKEKICGVMGRCAENGKLIGIPFEKSEMSYIEFHFGVNGGKYRDCCECVRLELLKKYKWPEIPHCKFVPEAYVYDKIGLSYNLLCTNEVLEEKEYLASGITKNKKENFEKNAAGYLVDLVDKIENIFPNASVRLKYRVVIWWKYWRLVDLDAEGYGPRCNRITLFGYVVKLLKPFLDLMRG